MKGSYWGGVLNDKTHIGMTLREKASTLAQIASTSERIHKSRQFSPKADESSCTKQGPTDIYIRDGGWILSAFLRTYSFCSSFSILPLHHQTAGEGMKSNRLTVFI